MSDRVVGFRYVLNAQEFKSANAEVDKDISNTAKAAQASANTQAAAMNNMSQAATSSAQRLAQVRGSIDQVNQALKEEALILSGQKQYFEQALGSGAQQQAQRYAEKIKQTEQNIADLLVQKIALSKEAGTLTNALTNTEGAFSRLTTRISVGRGALAGWDSVAEGFLRATGGINLGLAVGISLFSILTPKIIELVSAKKELVKIDSEYVALTAFNVQNGNLIVQMNHEQSRSSAALTGVILQVVENQRLLNEESQKGEQIQAKLKTANAGLTQEFKNSSVGYGAAVALNMKTTGDYQTMLAKSTETQAGFTKEIIEGMKGIDAYRAITHQGTDAVIEFARQQNFTNEQLDLLKKALDEDVGKMSEFASEAAKAALHTRSLAEATIAFNNARATAKSPDFSNAQFATSADTAKFAQDIATNLQAATQQGASFREAVLTQQSALKSLQQHLRETTLTQAGYHAELAKLPDATRRALVELEVIQKAMKNFADHTKQAESAAKALAKTTAELTAELEKAQAIEGGKTFDAQIKAAESAGEKKRQILIADHQLTTQNQATLTALTLANITKINNEHVKARETAEQRIATINLKTITDEYDAHKAAIAVRAAEDHKSFVSLGLDENEVYGLTIRAKQERADEFIKWFIDRNQKMYDELTRMGAAFDRQTAADRQKALANPRTGQNVDIGVSRQVKEFEAEQKIIDNLINKFQSRGGGAVQIFDMNQLAHAATLMRQYGLTVEDVDRAFGSASVTVGQFNSRVNILTQSNVSAIDTLSQMVDWSQVLTAGINAFTGAIAGAIAGTQDLGRALLASFFSIIGQIAITLGTLFTLAAAGFIFLPGFQWSAGQLAAAGVALLTFGAIMAGVGQKIANSGQNKAAASSGGGAASGGASQAGGNAAPTPPIQVPFNTTPARNDFSKIGWTDPNKRQEQSITLHIDSPAAADLVLRALEGKGMITLSSIGGRHAMHVKRVVKTMVGS